MKQNSCKVLICLFPCFFCQNSPGHNWDRPRSCYTRIFVKKQEVHDGEDAPLAWIAERVTKIGGGHPQKGSLSEFFTKVDADPDWFPGKHNGKKRGPKPVLTKAKRRCIAASAMSAKHTRGQEPCVAAVVEACPAASLNPNTGQPFSDFSIRKIFVEDCYDFDPAHPWRFQHALQKVFLPEPVKEHRCKMGRYLLRYGPTAAWWSQHVVWFDPCASILPGSQNQYDKMRQACKGKRRYISDDAKMYSPNLQGPPTALKQRSWEGRKVNWFMVLARGTLHVEVMPDEWTLNGAGLAQFVERLPAILRRMLGPDARLPLNVFTDRGTGMYTPIGKITSEYQAALEKVGFRSHWGADASRQSPDMADVLLHETAVAWFRKAMRSEKPVVAPWHETTAQWTARARRAIQKLNREHDVSSLSKEFPARLKELVAREGDRLPK